VEWWAGLIFMESTETPVWGWGAFIGLVVALLLVDLIGHSGGRGSTKKAAMLWTVGWIAAGVAFSVFVHGVFGPRAASEYLGVYFMEKALSVDNMFVFLVILRSLDIDPSSQRRALSWGIFGALLFRGVFIVAGAMAVQRFGALLYVFAGILLVAAYRVAREDPVQKGESAIVPWLQKHLPITADVPDSKFVVRRRGRWLGTPLLVALVSIELTDVAFAVDSVPAAFAISSDPFIIYSATVFALVGMRALYAVIATSIASLPYLHYGLAVILAFAGIKILTARWLHVPPFASAAVVLGVVAVAVIASLWRRGTAAKTSG
jgi:tellurite resistance protein TerC